MLAPKSVGRATFKLLNTGDKPLEIVAVSPSCKCTTVTDVVGKIIEPGGFVELEAVLDGAVATGSKSAEIKVLVDGYTGTVECRLRAEVSLPVRVTPGYINAVRGGPEQGTLTLASIDKAPFRICSAGGFPPDFVGFDPATDAPRSKYVINFDLTRFPSDSIPRYFVIETDHPACPVADVLVRHDKVKLKSGVRGAKDLKVNGGHIEPGGSGEFEIEFTKLAEKVEWVGVRSPTPNLVLEFLGVRTGEETDGEDVAHFIKFRATPAAGFSGLIYTPIFAQTKDGREQEVVFFTKVGSGTSCPEAKKP